MERPWRLGPASAVVLAFACVAARVGAEEETFRFHPPEGFVDARSAHGRTLEPGWPLFCGEEGVVACAFSPEFEDDGTRAFAYAKLVPGSQPVSDTLLARLGRSLSTAIDARDAVVHVDESSFERVGGHRVGRILATVRASGHTTRRWVWVMATPSSLAMVTFVAPEASFERLRPAFDASARATEGVIDGVPPFLRAMTQGHRRKGLIALLYAIVAILVVRVVVQAASKRPTTRR